MTTIKDIAARLGMAHSTVSRALNDHPHISEDTKRRVLTAARALSYIPNSGARSTRLGHSRNIGLVVPDIRNDFYSAAAKVMARTCAAEDFRLILCVSEDDPVLEQQHVQGLRESCAAGVVLAPTASPQPESLELLRELCTVQFLRRHGAIEGWALGIDDANGIAAATRHLIDLGHTRIGFIGTWKQLSTGQARLAGYRKALDDASLPMDPELVEIGAPQPEFGRDALARLTDLMDAPTGVVLSSPQQTMGAMESVALSGLTVPDELSLIGYGDAPWFRFWQPPLTTVSLPVSDMAATAAILLFRHIRAVDVETPTSTLPFQPALVVRASTSRPRRGRLLQKGRSR